MGQLRGRGTRLAVVAASLAVALVGCGPSGQPSDPGPTGTAAETGDNTGSASPTANPQTPAEVEAAERAAVETAYTNFWKMSYSFPTQYPQEQWPQVVTQIAVEPVSSQLLAGSAEQSQRGIALYGEVIPHVSWLQPISGQATATLNDCQDSSNAGTLEVATGSKITAGLPRSPVRGTLVKGPDGAWRVQQIEYLIDETC